MAPSKDPSKDAIPATGDDGRRTESGRNAEARSVLAAIETSVFAARRAETRGSAGAAPPPSSRYSFPMRDAIDLDAGERPWSLATLAERTAFDRHIETTATAIADRFTLKVHINIAARDAAFADWIDRVRAEGKPRLDYRSFVAVCAGLIAALAARRVVSYSALMGDQSGGMLGTILAYGNEVTALAAGAAVYALAVEDLTGTSPAEPLPALVVENAAASLRKHPEAALRFRELLRLPTPWT